MRVIIVLIFGVLLIGSCIGCSYYKELQKEKREHIDRYKINISKSDFRSAYPDSNQYQDLELEIKKDRTFIYSRKVPFICSEKGTWKINLGRYNTDCDFYYPDCDRNDQVLRDPRSFLYIKYPRAKPDSFINLLYFDRL